MVIHANPIIVVGDEFLASSVVVLVIVAVVLLEVLIEVLILEVDVPGSTVVVVV